MDIVRWAKWVLVAGMLVWVIQAPSNAGHIAARAGNYVIHGGESVVAAIATFVENIG